MLTLTNARVFDGGEVLKGSRSVAVDGDRIVGVTEGAASGGGERLDLKGMTLMPGLISCHLHSDNFKYAFADFLAGDQLGKERPPGFLMALGVRTCRVLVESGVLGYVGAGCSADVDAQLKMAIAEDIIPGPRILACGHHIGTTADNNDRRKWWQRFETPGIDLFADGPHAIRALVREEIRRGVEVIKVFLSSGHAVPGDRGKRNMARDELEAIVHAAHGRGAKVRTHVCHKNLIMEAIEVGVDIVDHGDEVDDECIEAMVEAGTYWVPSLLFLQLGVDQGWADPDGSMMAAYNNVRMAVPRAYKKGVKVLLGDDFGGDPLRHEVGGYAAEMKLYASLEGVTPLDVLRWGTQYGGELLAGGEGRAGVVRPGATADLIVIDGDPTKDLSLFADPQKYLKLVLRNGKPVINRI